MTIDWRLCRKKQHTSSGGSEAVYWQDADTWLFVQVTSMMKSETTLSLHAKCALLPMELPITHIPASWGPQLQVTAQVCDIGKHCF